MLCCVDSRGPVARLRLHGFAVLFDMSRVIQVVFARSGCAVILGTAGGLIGLVSWAARTAQSEYPRSPSSIVWAAVGGTFGFVLGACMGNRRLTGRRSGLVSGLVAGMLLGTLMGWIWAHAEYGFAQAQLLQAGLPATFIDAAEGGLNMRGYETIGLQYGICLGILAGSTAGWFWNSPQRLSSVANLFPVLISCFVALSVISMRIGFRDLSKDVIERACRSWAEWQSQALPEVSRFGPEIRHETIGDDHATPFSGREVGDLMTYGSGGRLAFRPEQMFSC